MLCVLTSTAASAALSTDSAGLAASLRAKNQAGQWQATLELFRAAKAGADQFSYTEAIVAHGRLKQSDKALDVFREMQEAGLTPNVVSCAQRALDLLPHCQLSPTPRPRRPAPVRRHGHDRRMREPQPLADRALALLRHAGGRCHARRLCHQCGDHACERGGQWEEAEMLLQEMQALGLSPDRVTYNTAIAAAARAAQWEQSLRLLDAMRAGGKATPGRVVVLGGDARVRQGRAAERRAAPLRDDAAGGPRGLGGDLQRGAARGRVARSALAARGHGRGSG